MTTTMTDREIYPSAPLRFVAFEMRMPQVPQFVHQNGPAAVYDQLREELPIIAPGPPSIRVDMPGAQQWLGAPFRMLDRRRMLSVSVTPISVIVETTSYVKYDDFEGVIERALRAVEAATAIPGIDRVGLRYIDEIRVSSVRRAGDWDGYINPALLGPLHVDDAFTPAFYEGLIQYQTANYERANVRYGAVEGRVVDVSGPLRLPSEEDGPFFLLDIDSFWTAPPDEVPPFAVDTVLATCESLRGPVRALFEAAITDKLRDEVLRKERSE